MEYTLLPGSGRKMSRLIMGCEQLSGTDWGSVDIEEAKRAVQHAFDAGVTAFDVADAYGLGAAEQVLSAALGARRHEAVIITKGGIKWRLPADGGRAETSRDASPAYLLAALEDSLRRLRLDCIPLYLVHWPDAVTPVEETAAALQRAKEQGKIQAFGFSNFPAGQLARVASVGSVAAAEFSCSLIEAATAEQLVPYCRQRGIATLAYGCLAQGLLTGKYGAANRFDSNDRRHRLRQFAAEAWDKNRPGLEELARVAAKYGKSQAQVAIRWVLQAAGVNCAIIGAKSVAQMENNLGAFGWQLEAEDWDSLASAFGVGTI